MLPKFPTLGPESTFGGDLMEFVEAYNRVLEQLDLSLADNEVGDRFPPIMWRVVAQNDSERQFNDALAAHEGRSTGMPPGTKPLINPADALID